MLSDQNLTNVSIILKDNSKKIWETAAHNQKQKIQVGAYNQTTIKIPPMTDANRLQKVFDLGIFLSGLRQNSLDTNVLGSKKHKYGILLKQDEDTKRLDNELLRSDHKRSVPKLNNPSIATIFSSYEVYLFMQLRHMRLRKFRSTLLRQLNFYRSGKTIVLV